MQAIVTPMIDEISTIGSVSSYQQVAAPQPARQHRQAPAVAPQRARPFLQQRTPQAPVQQPPVGPSPLERWWKDLITYLENVQVY